MSDQKKFLGKEKRQHKRVPFNYVVTCRDCSGNVESVSHFAFMHAKNMSAGGLLLESKYYYPPTTLLEIKLSIPSISHSIQVIGEVIRSEQVQQNNVFSLGISFVRIDDNCRQSLMKFVDDHSEQEEGSL
ncbi:PilZ domain-containing protein [bacterium]|nr:PilZ domain-containing protein [bacterium]MCP5462160.1 PilZ domain-containing protein [bacterium]